MSQIKYVHVIEFEHGERNIRPGKGDREGDVLRIPTPENDRDSFERVEYHRVGTWRLPEPMPKSEFVDWWNDHKDDNPQPSPIPEVLAAMDQGAEADA